MARKAVCADVRSLPHASRSLSLHLSNSTSQHISPAFFPPLTRGGQVSRATRESEKLSLAQAKKSFMGIMEKMRSPTEARSLAAWISNLFDEEEDEESGACAGLPDRCVFSMPNPPIHSWPRAGHHRGGAPRAAAH
jgi:hypothetical protein